MATVEDIEDAVEQGTQSTTTGNNKKGKTVTFDDGSVLTQKGFKFVYTDADGNKQPIGIEPGLKNRVDGSKNKALKAVVNKIKSDKTEEILGTFNSSDTDAYLASEKAEAERLSKKDKDAFYGKDADSTGKITSGKDTGKDSLKKQWMDSIDPAVYNMSTADRLGMALTDIGELFTAGDGQNLGVLSKENQTKYGLNYPDDTYETQAFDDQGNEITGTLVDNSGTPYNTYTEDNYEQNAFDDQGNEITGNDIIYEDGFTDPIGGGGSQGGGGGSSTPSIVSGLLEAIAARDAALTAKQGSLSERYAEFGDKYITNLNEAYKGLADTDFDNDYNAAKEAVWNQIKAEGLLDQADVTRRLAPIEQQYSTGDSQISSMADAFSSGIQGQIGDTYNTTSGELSGLAYESGNPEDYISQTQAINSFDVITPFNQYSNVMPTESDFEDIDLFVDFDKYTGDDLSTAFDESNYNVQAVSASPKFKGSGSTISAVDAIKSASRDPFGTPIKTSTMKNPFGSSVRMVV